jgi:hypothetical protein
MAASALQDDRTPDLATDRLASPTMAPKIRADQVPAWASRPDQHPIAQPVAELPVRVPWIARELAPVRATKAAFVTGVMPPWA